MAASLRHPAIFAVVILLLHPASARGTNCPDAVPAPVSARAFAWGDFDGDGQLDVVVAGSGEVHFLHGTGYGTFGPATTVLARTDLRDVAAGDFDDNGTLDLVVLKRSSQGVLVLSGAGDGTFADPLVYDAGATPASVAVGDVNGDGISDLAVLNEGNGRVGILRGQGSGGTGDGTFLFNHSFLMTKANAQEARLEMLDLDRDGALDLVANSYATEVINFVTVVTKRIAVAHGRTSGGEPVGFFDVFVNLDTTLRPFDFAVADFDGDGQYDVVVADPAQAKLEFRPGLDGRSFGAPHVQTVALAGQALAVGDVDGDQDVEILFPAGEEVGVLHFDGVGSGIAGRAGTQEKTAGLAGAVRIAIGDAGQGMPLEYLVLSSSGAQIALRNTQCSLGPPPPPPPPPGPPTMPPPQEPVPQGFTAEPCWDKGGKTIVPEAVSPDGLSRAPDGTGGAYLTWRDRRLLSQGEIFLARIGPDGETVPPWPPGGVRLRAPSNTPPTAAPFPDGSGGVVVVMSENTGTGNHLWAHRIAPDGSAAPGWPIGGLLIDSPTFAPLSFAGDGSGGVLAVGRSPSLTPGLSEFRVRRWSATGETAIGWPAEGVTAATTPTTNTSMSFSNAVGDGRGGIYLAWDTYIPPCNGHGCGQGSWWDSFAYVLNGQLTWSASSSYAVGSPWLSPDGRGNAFGYYTANGTPARCVLWTPTGNLWNVWSPTHLWAGRGAVGDGNGGALFLAETMDQTGLHLFRFDWRGNTPSPWSPAGLPMFPIGSTDVAAMLPDMQGGALTLTYTEGAPDTWDLRAHYVTAQAELDPDWPSGGLLLRAGTTLTPPPNVLGVLRPDGYLLFWIGTNEQGQPVILGQRLCPEAPVPAALSFLDFTFEDGGLNLRWSAATAQFDRAEVERRAGTDASWEIVGEASFDPAGFFTFSDRSTRPGDVFEYRLSVRSRGELFVSEATRIAVPASTLTLALELPHQPMRAGETLRFALPGAGHARLEMFDARGRRVWSQGHDAGAGGWFEATVPSSLRSGSGVYWLRLTHGGSARNTRLVLLD